jgi:RNA polymerase sigma-70 factor (ECF subfamily)
MNDLEAIHRLKRGDIGGLENLVERHQLHAVRAAYLVTRDPAAAEEVAQEAFIRFYERAAGFDLERPFEPYFLRMVVNLALNRAEKERRSSASLEEESALPEVERLIAGASSIEDQVEYRQRKEEIDRALAALPGRQRAAAVMRYYLGMSESEMSAALEAAPGTVKWLLHAARESLRGLLRRERSAE